MPNDLIRVRSAHACHAENPDHLMFHEHHDAHPRGEARVYGGEIVEAAETDWLRAAISDGWLERTDEPAQSLAERIRVHVIRTEHTGGTVRLRDLEARYGEEAVRSVWPVEHLSLAGDGTVLVDHAAVEGRS